MSPAWPASTSSTRPVTTLTYTLAGGGTLGTQVTPAYRHSLPSTRKKPGKTPGFFIFRDPHFTLPGKWKSQGCAHPET